MKKIDFKFLKKVNKKKIKKCKKCKKLFLSEKDTQGTNYKIKCFTCSEYDKYELRKKIFNNENTNKFKK